MTAKVTQDVWDEKGFPKIIGPVSLFLEDDGESVREDIVDSAAHEHDEFSEGDIREFIQGRTKRQPTDDEIKELHSDVRKKRVRVLVDVVDTGLRKRIDGMMKTRKTVQVKAPKGWTRKVFNSLSDDELNYVARRLRARGWDQNILNEKLIPEERQPVVSE